MDKIFIAGAGGIGRAAALLILDAQGWDCEVIIGDVSADQLEEANNWIQLGIGKKASLGTFLMPADGSAEAFGSVLSDAHVLLDCLPGSLAPSMARLCIQYELHYVNLTEYVQETKEIIEMAADAETGFILQTGLAPGYVNNLGVHLVESFMQRYGVEKLEKLSMRVGALTQFSESPHFYGFTWSTIGVATEYIKDSEAVRNHQIVRLPSLSEPETIILNGRRYEADLTSGGAADLPHELKEQIANIDYKTIRYPGHFDWVKSYLKNDQDPSTGIARLEAYMLKNVPHIEDDVIVIYAAVTGYDRDGHLRSMQNAQHIYPLMVGGITMRAIQTCTAAPMVECARLLLTGEYRGIITQSQIDPSAILEGTIVKQAYQSYHSEV
ncbi:MAG: saccharopine dehydrogenase C-terminal domain-containing protein [Saprospiraceae bacterium]|nr:saccharopine dehydrogenase C-terminal domain-containing protein [Saprospiraceae bacterium]